MPGLSGLAAAAGASVISRLFASGTHRIGSLVFQKALRVCKIEQAIKLGSVRNKNVTTALNDFETLVGSCYGQLTERLDLFFREIERGGVVNQLVDNAILTKDSPELQRLFCDIHANILGDNAGDANALYKSMTTSFSVTVKELCQDKVLLDAFRIHREELDSRLEAINDSIGTLHQLYKTARLELSYDRLTELLLKVAKALQASYRTIRIETNKGARSVDLTKVYIPSSLQYRNTIDNQAKISNLSAITKGRDLNELLETTDTTQRFAIFPYKELRFQFNRAVILGDPGGGKSTLCQHLCLDLAKQAVAAIQGTDPSRISAQLQKFPIRVILRTYEKARGQEPQLSIYEYIIRDWANYIHAEPAELRIALNHLLCTGSAVLAFDGLDEILVTARRREFVDLVLAFCNQYPLCPVIVTSRLVGYDDAPLSEDFDDLVLEKFTDEEVLSYAKKFLKVVGGHTDKEAQPLADVFYSQTTQNASDLRRNPLMLGLMAWIFNIRRDVPSNRPEIYRECAILMFERWDPDREIKPEIPSDFDRLQLFSELAAKIYGDPQLSAGVERNWLELHTRKFFEQIYEDKSRAFQASKALVSFITGRAWLSVATALPPRCGDVVCVANVNSKLPAM